MVTGQIDTCIMLFQVRSNEQIEGIKINDFEVKLAAYADDTYFFTLDIRSLLAVLNTCKTFQELSSLKLNLEKCQACWIGAAKDKSDTPINCNWININHHKVVTLGVFNSYNCSLAEKHNFLNQITSVKEKLHTLGDRGLTLAGRILIFKSMALSKAVYTSTMVSPPKQFIDLLSSIKQNFIWNGCHPKIKHSTLVGEYAEGGYKDVDIQSQLESLKIIWIRRLLDNNFHAWKSISNVHFLDLGVNAVFHDNFKPSTYCIQKIQSYPLFYQQLIGFWEKVSRKEPLNALEIVNHVIWNNSFLLKQGNSLFYPSLYNKGILKVSDLLDDFGHFMKWALAKLKFDLKEQDAML